MSRIAIIGAGAWGTGLAIVLGRNETHHGRHGVRHHVHELCKLVTALLEIDYAVARVQRSRSA